jgi:hypothetical protein
MLDVRTHTDGGQTAEAVAERVVAWLRAARRTLDLALYDVRLPDEVGDRVGGASTDAAARGVRVRIAFNQDERPPDEDAVERPFFPAPPRTEPHVRETLGVPVKPIPGWRDLMHPGGFAPYSRRFAAGSPSRMTRPAGRWTRSRARRT